MKVTRCLRGTVTNQQGFGLVGSLVVIVVILAVGGAGIYAYHKDHDKQKVATNTTSTKKNTSSNTSTATANPYAGWKTYCDNTYGYCFEYPADWALDVNATAQEPCDSGQVTITSSDKSVSLVYINDNNKDQATGSYTITPYGITSPNKSGQTVSILGTIYADTNGMYYPEYNVVDSSLVDSANLTVGVKSQLTSPQQSLDLFTDQSSLNKYTCQGTFSTTTSQGFATLTSANSWFNTSDGKTTLLLLKSFYHE